MEGDKQWSRQDTSRSTDASSEPMSAEEEGSKLRIFLLASAYNGMTQAVHEYLAVRGHFVRMEPASDEPAYRAAIDEFAPDLILCPFLKEFVPIDIFARYKTIIIHPGIVGDRGPSSIDWALLQGREEWGVVLVEGDKEFDAGPVWASVTFPLRKGVTKSHVYGELVTSAAVEAVGATVENFLAFRLGAFTPEAIDFEAPWILGQKMPLMKQSECAILWERDSTADIVRKVASRDGQPGLLDSFGGAKVYLYGAHAEQNLRGDVKQLLATRNGAVCLGTTDGAVWISHMRLSKLGGRDTCTPHAARLYKMPAAIVLGKQLNQELAVPEVPLGLDYAPAGTTLQDVAYQKRGEVGVVLFQFYNGAMGTEHCKRLTACLQHAKAQRDTKVIVLAGGSVLHGGAGYFSNGVHLNLIDFAANPAEEGWENINAIDDACLEILTAKDHLVVACVCGNAGAGGAMMPLGADVVLAKAKIVFNPHYAKMGLYGSEYWTYSLPKRVGEEMAAKLTTECKPVIAERAKDLGMVDQVIEGTTSQVLGEAVLKARRLCLEVETLLVQKQAALNVLERERPLQSFRDAELAEMHRNFFEDSLGFAQLRRAFVMKVPATKN